MQLREVPNEVGSGELRRQVVVLGCVANARAHPDARCGGILTEHDEVAFIAGAEPEHE